jgi:hypothetical protein
MAEVSDGVNLMPITAAIGQEWRNCQSVCYFSSAMIYGLANHIDELASSLKVINNFRIVDQGDEYHSV